MSSNPVIVPGNFQSFLNKPPDLFCLIIRVLTVSAAFSVYSVPVYCFIAALSLDRVKIREQVLAPAIGLFHPD